MTSIITSYLSLSLIGWFFFGSTTSKFLFDSPATSQLNIKSGSCFALITKTMTQNKLKAPLQLIVP